MKHPNLAKRARKIIEARTNKFSDLLRISELDPRKHLRFADWSGVDFTDDDLRGFDFTGARLHNCRFGGTLIKGAHFDQAEINGTNLRAARDWDAYSRSWTAPDRVVHDRHLPVGAVFQDVPFGPELIVVPAGSFLMGSPEEEPEEFSRVGPQHEVTIPQPFAVGRYAVTFEEWDFAQSDKEWRKITKLKSHEPQDHGGEGRDRPVINVSWEDARAYVRWLSAKTGKAYSLLSEAEWEYCCRAGSVTPFSWGSTISQEQANFKCFMASTQHWERDEHWRQTKPVDAFKPNPFGLYQMHGNVWEWVEDIWHDSYDEAPSDGSAWITGDDNVRVIRGGSWYDFLTELSAASRSKTSQIIRNGNVGFRLSRTLIR